MEAAVEAGTRRSPAGVAAVVTAVTVWGLGNVLAKFIHLSGPALSFDRLWFGAAYSFALVFAFRRRMSFGALRLAAPGGIAFGLNIVLFFTAVKVTSVTDATIISALQPALLLGVAARLFGERVTAAVIAGTAVALAGTAVVVLAPGGGRGDVWGDLVAAGALFAWAWYFVASKRARRDMGTLEYQAAMTLVAALVVTPVALGYRSPLTGGHWTVFGWVALLAIVPGGGHFLVNWAHEHVTLTVASLLTLGIPVVAMLGAAVFLGERISPVQWIGTAVVIAALAAVILAGGDASARRAVAEGAAPPGTEPKS